MTREDMLAKLMDQAREMGCDILTLRAIVEESSEVGADRVLSRLKLNDERAQKDLGELRDLLIAWRTAKASAWKAAMGWVIRGLMAALLIGMAVRLGLTDMIK